MSTAAKMLRNGKSALFATRESTTEALEYVFQILGKSPETATAVMVYHNTLLEEAARVIEEYENATNESNNKGRTRH